MRDLTIEIENDYVQAIMEHFAVRTKTEAVDLALRHLAGGPISPEEARVIRGRFALPDDYPVAPPAVSSTVRPGVPPTKR